MQNSVRSRSGRLFTSIGAAIAIAAATLLGAAAPASAAAGDGVATLPTISDDQWFIGSTKAVTVGWTNTVDTITSAMVRSPWPWGSAWAVDTTGVTAGGDLSGSGTRSVTCSQGSTLIATFTFSNVTLSGSPTCKFEKSAYWHGFWVTGNMSVAVGSTVSVEIPSGQITAPTTAQTDTWLVGKYDSSAVGPPLALISSTAYLNPPALAENTFPSQPPQNVRVAKVADATTGNDVLRVSWDTPSDQGTLPVTHYSVYGGPDWGSPSHPVKVATCATGPGLWSNPGNSDLNSCVVNSRNLGYTPQLGANVFYVKAFNGLGWSGAAESNALLIEPDLSPPSAPLDVVAVGGWKKVTVTWKKPVKAGGYPITNYLASSDPDRKSCITVATSYSGGALDVNPLSCDFTNLTAGKRYTFTAQALNGNGWSDRSVVSNVARPQDVRITGYNRKKLGLFSLFKSEVTVKGATLAIPVGAIVTPWVSVGAKEKWVAQPTFKATAKEDFTWTQKFDRKVDDSTISVKFAWDGHDSNVVVIPRVK